MRFRAFPRHQHRGSARHGGFHAAAAFRPKVFSTSRRFPPCDALRVCFTPLARLGFPLQGFLLPGSRSPFPGPLPSCRYQRPSSPLRERRGVDSASRPCSPWKSVATGQRLNRPGARCPPGVHPLQGSPSFGRGSRFRDPPLSCFGRVRTRRPLTCTSGYLRTEGPTCLSRDRRPS